jgi:RNA polymerase sigma-70 factor (ECF subfamily)
LWQKKETLDNVQNIEAFAMQMTRNRCLDILRDKKNKPAASATMQIVKTDATDVHLQVEFSDSAKLIKRLVNELPDLQRKIMQMKDIDQLEYEEIAEITNMEMNAIRVNLSRARKKVRDEFVKLNDNGNFENKRFTAKIL